MFFTLWESLSIDGPEPVTKNFGECQRVLYMLSLQTLTGPADAVRSSLYPVPCALRLDTRGRSHALRADEASPRNRALSKGGFEAFAQDIYSLIKLLFLDG